MRIAKPNWVGVDTPFLVAHTVSGHPAHERAIHHREHLLENNCLLALCPTVIDEFIHVVTDPRRFERSLEMVEALEIADGWLNSRETVELFSCERSLRLHIRWLSSHRLGRQRINDTRIASIYHQNGIRTLLTSNARDFTIFDCFDIIPLDDTPPTYSCPTLPD